MRKLVVVSIMFGSLLVASSAQAAIPSALGVTCSVAADGVRECGSTRRPAAPHRAGTARRSTSTSRSPRYPSGTDGNYPLIIIGHGYGGSKIDFCPRARHPDAGVHRPRLRRLHHDRPWLPRVLRHAGVDHRRRGPPATTATST